ncbi:MAG: tetratricopeptide repeat protein [Balneolaceae bacterium]|nr:tetratricopeptide repeat protein [Balneolaceae bacterium]
MKVFKSIFLTALFAIASTLAFAQEEADAINAYNEAQELAQSKDFDAAIDKFGEAIELGEAVGNTDIVTRSKNYIPKLHYQKAASAFQAFRSSPSVEGLDNVIALFNTSQEMGSEYGDDDISNRSRGVLAQLHYQKATMLFKREDFEGADTELDAALQINPNYAKAYYQKGLVAKKLDGEVETIMSWFDRAINVGNQVNDNTVVRQATNSAHAELLFRGSKAIENNRLSNAIQLLQSSLTYNSESSDSYYRLAEASNKQGNYDRAIEFATTSLEYEQGGATDKAKIYFELGFAQQSKGNKAQACEAFTNASYGSFKAPSEHKMEFELKCESTN